MKTVSESAGEWGVTTQIVYLWIAQGLVKVKRHGKRGTMVLTKLRPKIARGRPKKK